MISSKIVELLQKHEEKEEKLTIIYFKKIYQQIYDDDDKLRKIMRNFMELLPNELKEIMKITICNMVSKKIRRYLN